MRVRFVPQFMTAGAGFAIAGLLLGVALSPHALAQDDVAPMETAVATEAPPADLNPMDDVSDAERVRLNPNLARTAAPTPAPAAALPEAPAAALPEASAADTAAEVAADATTDAAGEMTASDASSDDAVVETAQTASDATGSGDATAGDGGRADTSGDGGLIIQSATITGNNRGSEIVVNDCAYGSVQIDGGEIINASDIELSANGGVAVSTANGGDDNVVRAGGAVASQLITAGNGGNAGSDANGGTIITGATISGNNRGNEVSFADCPNGRGNATLIVDAGNITNTTDITMSADGGTAIADASGGDGNIGITGGRGREDAAAGNGGRATASADGGVILAGPMITGNNRGNAITVGTANADGTGSQTGVVSCLGGAVLMVIDGGDITNSTTIDLSADGGVAIADASGGDDNLAVGNGAAGNGGRADAAANGGSIMTGAMITGNNRGNEINVGNVSPGCAPVAAPAAPAAAPGSGNGGGLKVIQASGKPPARRGGRQVQAVQSLPDTGTGPGAGAATASYLPALALIGLVGAGAAVAGRRCAGLGR